MARRRSAEEIAATLDARSAKLKADADRRRSVASDALCNYLWDAECALQRAALTAGGLWLKDAIELRIKHIREWREQHWEEVKAKGLTP